MEIRKLGAAGPLCSAVGLGCLGLTGGYGRVDADAAVDVVRAALDRGVTLLDTADFYGGGSVEELLGRALAGRREQAVIATRGGAVFAGSRRPTAFDGSPAFLRRACEASLRRLGTDHIDLYHLARVDPKVPVEESVGGLAELVAEGKIRHIGLSEAPADVLRRAHAVHPVAAVAAEYSLWSRDVEDAVLPVARELGIGLVACSPLGRGFLAGAVGANGPAEGDYRRNHPRFAPENLARNRVLLGEAARIAEETGVPLGRLALAWVLTRGEDIVPIPGTVRREHLLENIAAAAERLSAADAARLADCFPADAVAGSRLPGDPPR
ncbi:Predicted oxidoreductase [Streptomyces misionensis]|uniref:Predicted oxidoreductase n=1 Tax=Streptomyces misionensis TaxID=67331 RepID=A0A1H4ICI3_9ACTN|nr:aldo/keto reductase [Streptomyces misionensis]SEB30972.1 Predicted oxidoreductase [Streptomyces misionensis]